MKMKWFSKKVKAADLPDDLRYRAFLSYRTGDKNIAEWLHKKIEHYRVPRKLVGKAGRHGSIPARVGPIFRDRDDARSSHDIETFIAYQLSRSQHLIVLCTPRATEKEAWVGREIELFRERRPGAETHAVIGRGEPPSCFPKQLLSYETDGKRRQPLAVDLRSRRQGGDGKAKAVIKLIAALIGTEFDDLWQRERRRRTVRLIFFAVALVVVAVFAESYYWITKYELPLASIVMQQRYRLGYVPVPELMALPAGSFEMGEQNEEFLKQLPEPEDNRPYFGAPVKQVGIAQGFGLGMYEVTYEQFDRYVWENHRAGYRDVAYPTTAKGGRGTRPVVNVTGYEAMNYAAWLGLRTRLDCRLPTEAEWEYAARANTNTAYPWGDEIRRKRGDEEEFMANCDGCGSRWDNDQSAPVGSFPPNAFGLHDMSGNVWEWTCSLWRKAFDGNEQRCAEKRNTDAWVLRGGSWADSPDYMRSTARNVQYPVNSLGRIGFRVLCSFPRRAGFRLPLPNDGRH